MSETETSRGGPVLRQAGKKAPSRERKGSRSHRRGADPPDILYHATTRRRVERVLSRGVLELPGGRPVFMSRHEGQAWQVAHRQADEPMVLYVDASRARRDGCRFRLNSRGLWEATPIPVQHVLNLRDGFAEQVSAGGVPMVDTPDGVRLLLIRVRRRHGATWEVAKGKLEPGETPAQTAVREVREELGVDLPLDLDRYLGTVRYGFLTPEGDPRLKTLHMYLMRTPEQVDGFDPPEREGIVDVAWFTPSRAARAVTHRSLRPLMRKLRWMLEQNW